MTDGWPWAALGLLGAFHGLNPAMGWLFAVALGLQERSRAAVLRAFLPIAAGHAASVALVLTVAGGAALAVPGLIRLAGGGALVLFGLFRLVRPRHPRWVGMRVGPWDLAAWSFLVASAHGAGLMLLPLLLAAGPPHGAGHGPVAALAAWGAGAAAVHTLAMLLTTAAVALVVYEKVGLALLHRGWINLDLLWAGALVGAGLLTLLV